MSGNPRRPQNSDDSDETLSARWTRAVSLVESQPEEAVSLLQSIQENAVTLSLFSPNETMDDVGTKSLPLLSVEYYLAMAHLSISSPPPGNAKMRMENLHQATTLFSSFLHRLEQYQALSQKSADYYHGLLQQSEEDGDRIAAVSRDDKIARFRARREIQDQLKRLEALKHRRQRLGEGLEDTEEMDGYDQESLERALQMTTLQLNVSQALDEWQQAKREVPMVQMTLKMQEQNEGKDRREHDKDSKPPPLSSKPLQLTHITKNDATGQLNIRKEEIRSKVFRPSWNQPTMTLEQLAEIEVSQAREREARQQELEAQQMYEPRRYDQLVQDGMEDNADLVDASAAKDRAWDDFKDANPRGSGNKMGDRGDRNF